MRILWLADFYPPFIGGLERHVQMIASELASRGHDVCVATIWHEGMPHFEVDNGVRVYRLIGSTQKFPFLSSDAQRRFHPTAPDPFIVKKLLEIIDREKPKIVIASGWILYSFFPVKGSFKCKAFRQASRLCVYLPKTDIIFKGGDLHWTRHL